MKKLYVILLLISILDARFIRHSTKIVIDVQTGLMWQDTSENNSTQKLWYDSSDNNETASKYCHDLNITFSINSSSAYYDDWRLPNYNELISIVDRNQTATAIYDAFLYTKEDHYWTSTTYNSSTTKAWTINFYYGEDDIKSKDETHYVRCVRTTGDNNGDGVKD
jgi:aspartyl/asparaginyl beta-hydroxylase (cupin superfamily)